MPITTDERYQWNCLCGKHDTVMVEERYTPGVFQPAGVARVIQDNQDGTYNVKYITGDTAKRVIAHEITCQSDDEGRPQRAPKRRELMNVAPDPVKKKAGARTKKRKTTQTSRHSEKVEEAPQRMNDENISPEGVTAISASTGQPKPLALQSHSKNFQNISQSDPDTKSSSQCDDSLTKVDAQASDALSQECGKIDEEALQRQQQLRNAVFSVVQTAEEEVSIDIFMNQVKGIVQSEYHNSELLEVCQKLEDDNVLLYDEAAGMIYIV
mmetsp:Transcript_3121/g.3963  ORF Transcript_3121/g.3963 Transcript_3121/m.3963 type:complete len:268 (+) Transcript_3121:161-964(+)